MTSALPAVAALHDMPDAITVGSILIETRAHLPQSIRLQSRPDSSGWTAPNGSRSMFEDEIDEAGWTFFFMAGEIKTTVFDSDRQKALRVALERLIVNVKAHNCNAIEITRITAKSFFKVPYTIVTAHVRHLQEGSTFSSEIFPGSI